MGGGAGSASYRYLKKRDDAVTTGKVDLDSIEEDNLPAALQAVAPEERKQVIAEVAQVRSELRQKIARLSQDRSEFLKDKVDEAGGREDSLDDKIYRAVKSQAKSVGLLYESEVAEY